MGKKNITEIIELHHEASVNFEFWMEKDKKKIKEHTETRIRIRHQKDE